MSMWNHWHNLRPEAIDELNNAPDREGPIYPYPPESLSDAFDEWLARGSFDWELDSYPFWTHLHHAQSWWDYRHLPNILFVHFDDLLSDIDGQMRRISDYLDIPVNEEIWPDLLKGTSKRWQGDLTEEQSERYEDLAAQRLEPELKRWLAAGSL